MARRSLPRILKGIESTATSVRWYRLCAAECECDPASVTELSRDDYLRIAHEYVEIGVELMEEAVTTLRDATDEQLTSWLAHPDHRVRQFVIEWMNVRGDRR